MTKDLNDDQTIDAFPPKRGRGRPKKADALSNAQRQARFKEKNRAKGVAQDVSPTGDRVLDDAFKTLDYRDKESLRNLVLICTLRRRNSQHAELLRAVDLLQARLRAAGLSDEVPPNGFRGATWYWNENPPVDYRPTDPQGDSTPHPSDEEAFKWRPAYMRS